MQAYLLGELTKPAERPIKLPAADQAPRGTEHLGVENRRNLEGRDQVAAADLIVDLVVLPVDRWHMSPLLPRRWELRDNLTPCDAAYVAVAELAGAVLVTGDELITAAPGPRCDIQIIK
jgi:predicted nucleic acid-binding protein